MKWVITYLFAYIEGQISLCDRCTDSVDSKVSLGPVVHGLHRGYCAACSDRGDD